MLHAHRLGVCACVHVYVCVYTYKSLLIISCMPWIIYALYVYRMCMHYADLFSASPEHFYFIHHPDYSFL